MWPLAESKPKHLLPVAGKPILSYVLQALAESSVKEVFVVVGYRGDLIRSVLGDGGCCGLHIEYLNQPRWTGTASAVKVAYQALGKGPFLVLYGDLWVSSSAVQAVMEKAREFPRVMGVVRIPNASEYGVVELEGDKILSVVEKPSRAPSAEGWVNTGIYVLDEEVFRAVERTAVSKRSEYELTSSLQHLLRQGKEIKGAVVSREDWMDVGRPWDLLEASERVLSNLPHRVGGTVEQGAVLKGPIWLEESASVKSGSQIEGPAFIGKDCRIGPNARIRPYSCIEDAGVIGTSCEIKSSIVMSGTRIPHLSYIGDSIIGENCNIGAGTITGNLRLDDETVKMRVKGRLLSTGRKKLGVIMGDRVQTGINVSIMPGVRIGSDARVGPGVILYRDIPSGQSIMARQTTIKKLAKTRKSAEHKVV